MPKPHKPVLIFAQTGRLLTQSATQAGYTVWVTDCFGDQDTLLAAERWQPLPPFTNLTQETILDTFEKLTQSEGCDIICGSGIESCYSILNSLPDNVQLIGNTAQTIHAIKSPLLFFELLNQLEIAHPDTQFERPINHANWLVKSNEGLGGSHIQHLSHATPVVGAYFQHFILGESGSCLFLANGKHTQLININKQTLSPDEGRPFRLGGLDSAWEISLQHQQELESAIERLTVATHLKGLNSADFIISEQDELLLLEINPRPSASMELVHSNPPIFQHHLNACYGELPDETLTQAASISLRYFYARQKYLVPNKMIWPPHCYDLPTAGTIIHRNEPICTSIVQLTESEQLHRNNEHLVVQQLISST